MPSKLLLDLFRPVLRALPVGGGRLYRALGGYAPSPVWQRHGVRLARGTDHGYQMVLYLSDPFQRETFYLGRFYEWEIQGVIDRALSRGDTFVDVGANIGMLTLYAAAVVGAEGCVLAFEPNPEAFIHAQMHVQMNGLGNVTLFRQALSSDKSTSILSVPAGRSGTGTLRAIRTPDAPSLEVETALLDDFADEIPSEGTVLINSN